jgi:hypothetical protein
MLLGAWLTAPKGGTMEVRYLGFEQQQNARAYRFDVLEKGQPNRHFTVTADLTLFLQYHVGIQEGPTLSASKLAADLESNSDGAHELTGDDLRSHVNARALAEAQRAEARKTPRRRPAPPAPVEQRSPWRPYGL